MLCCVYKDHITYLDETDDCSWKCDHMEVDAYSVHETKDEYNFLNSIQL